MKISNNAYNGYVNSADSAKRSTQKPFDEYLDENAEEVNLRDISINEINTLIKAGYTEFLEVVPIISDKLINEYGRENTGQIKVDYLGQIESIINFRKSNNEDVSRYEILLAKLEKIDGSLMPESDENL